MLNFFQFKIAQFTYIRMGDAESYINSLLVIPDIQDNIINHMQQLKMIIGNKSCNVSLVFSS